MGRVYLVDDHALMREGLRAVLEGRGYTVVGEAATPAQALADISRLGPDVVLLDLGLGERSGIELLNEVQGRKIDVPVVVLTASAQPRDVAEALRLGAMGYVVKGSSSIDLMRAIEAALQGRRHLGANEADLALKGFTQTARSLDALSPRERQIATMVARGASSTDIGERLHLSPKTVDTYRSRLMSKLGMADVPALVRWAVREGLVGLDE